MATFPELALRFFGQDVISLVSAIFGSCGSDCSHCILDGPLDRLRPRCLLPVGLVLQAPSLGRLTHKIWPGDTNWAKVEPFPCASWAYQLQKKHKYIALNCDPFGSWWIKWSFYKFIMWRPDHMNDSQGDTTERALSFHLRCASKKHLGCRDKDARNSINQKGCYQVLPMLLSVRRLTMTCNDLLYTIYSWNDYVCDILYCHDILCH